MSTSTTNRNTDLQKAAQSGLKSATQKDTFQGLKQPEIEFVLNQYAGAIAAGMPGGFKANRIIQAAVFKIVTDPKLQVCTQKSVIGAVLNAALLGLSPALGECHFVPYRNRDTGQSECQFQPDYKGLITLARRSAQIQNIYADVVRQGDEFQVKSGLHRDLVHNPDLDGGSDRALLFAYAVVWYSNGSFDFEVMDRRQVDTARRKNLMQRNGAAGAWLEFEDEMWKKTVLRRLSKRMPKSDELATALATDGVVIRPENIEPDGTIKVEEVARMDLDNAEAITPHEEEAPATPDREAYLDKFREGVEGCNDLNALQKYWSQGKGTFQADEDVATIFSNRKAELTNGK